MLRQNCTVENLDRIQLVLLLLVILGVLLLMGLRTFREGASLRYSNLGNNFDYSQGNESNEMVALGEPYRKKRGWVRRFSKFGHPNFDYSQSNDNPALDDLREKYRQSRSRK